MENKIILKQIYTVFNYLLLLSSILGSSLYFASDQPLSWYYYLNKNKYKDAIFIIKSVNYYDSSRPNIQLWNINGFIEKQSLQIRTISAADLLDVSKISDSDELKLHINLEKKIKIKIKEGKPFIINGRDINIIPIKKSQIINLSKLVKNLFLYNLCWIIFLIYRSYGRSISGKK